MYIIENKSDIWVTYNQLQEGYYNSKIILKKIGNENDLIKFLAEGFSYFIINWDDNNNKPIYMIKNKRLAYLYFDGYNRKYCSYTYYNDALEYFNLYLKNNNTFYKRKYYKWRNIYRYKYRNGPVEHIHKRRGGPCIKSRHIKQIKKMYLDPEQKSFNRGSINDLPLGWWDDWDRSVERNWKSQSKAKHQWERR